MARNTRANDVEMIFSSVNETLSRIKQNGEVSKSFRVTTLDGNEAWIAKSQATRITDPNRESGITTEPEFCTFMVAGWLAAKIDGKPVMG